MHSYLSKEIVCIIVKSLTFIASGISPNFSHFLLVTQTLLLWSWPLRSSALCSSLFSLLALHKVFTGTFSHPGRGFLSRGHLWANKEKIPLQRGDKALRVQDLGVPCVLGWTVIRCPPLQADAAWMTARQAEDGLAVSPHRSWEPSSTILHCPLPSSHFWLWEGSTNKIIHYIWVHENWWRYNIPPRYFRFPRIHSLISPKKEPSEV